MREQSRNREIYNNYIIDDGWNIPKEVIEVIELRIARAWQDAVAEMKKKRDAHKGAFITKEIADAYIHEAWPYRMVNGNQYTGFVRELGIDLQDKYGVTELEAINILNGIHVKDYIHKYDCMKNLIPPVVHTQAICDGVLHEYGYCQEVV